VGDVAEPLAPRSSYPGRRRGDSELESSTWLFGILVHPYVWIEAHVVPRRVLEVDLNLRRAAVASPTKVGGLALHLKSMRECYSEV
jgi:hypothetical protein